MFELFFKSALFVFFTIHLAFGFNEYPTIFPSKYSASEIRAKVLKDGIEFQKFSVDSGETPDLCSRDLNCLLSEKNLRNLSRSTPVVILAHGFTATTYEWQDLAGYLEEHHQGKILYSQVLLGGHGRSLLEFSRTTWRDWGEPILAEYDQLQALGFNNISIAASSTSCALVLQQLSQGDYSSDTVLRNVFLIDPLVKPIGRVSSAIAWLGSFSSRSYGPTQAFSPEEFSHWYGWRPFSSLNSANELAGIVTHALSHGIELPRGTNLYVWASQGDPTVDPTGYLSIERGVKPVNHVHAFPVDSKLHVFTRLSGRPTYVPEDDLDKRPVAEKIKDTPISVTKHDRDNQKKVFERIVAAVSAGARASNSKLP